MKQPLNALGQHISAGALVCYHDGTLHDEQRRESIRQHLAQCVECHRRLKAVDLIHPSAEELMDFHDGIVRNTLTHTRVKTHLRDKHCPLCAGWLEALRQAQEEAAKGGVEAIWQELSPMPQSRVPLSPPVSAAKLPQVAVASSGWWPKPTAVVRWLREALSVPLVPARVLSEGGTEEGINRESVQEIPLLSVFEESVLNERLPWAGPRLEIAKVGPPEAATAPYAAHLELRTGEAQPYGSLRLMLTAASGQSSQVQLSADCPAGVFEGDALPSDWEAVTLHLFLEEGASDA